MPQNEEGRFIKEKIKDKPKNNKKLVQKCMATIGYAVLFGFVSCLVFCAMKPHVEQWLEPKPETIKIPKDVRDEGLGDEGQTVADDESKESASTKKKKNTVYITERKSMTVEDYQLLQNQIYQIGRSLNHSVVTVTGITDGTDLLDAEYESTGQSCGLIIGKNNAELLIFTEYHVAKDASSIRVTFSNNETYGAKIKAYDGSTGIAVLSMKLSKLSESTQKYIEVAKLGNSFSCRQGELVVAIGSPLGMNASILTGTLTSVTSSVVVEDANYAMFTTDMVTEGYGCGALVNTDGEIIGLFLPTEALKKDATLAALSVSELKALIESLSNGKEVPYVGIKGSTVTEAISEEYGLPQGIYIKQVTMGSPAMEAGLQNGDVITSVGGEVVKSMEEYQARLLKLEPESKVNITLRRQNGTTYKKTVCKVVLGKL